jgi:hypothetical protein
MVIHHEREEKTSTPDTKHPTNNRPEEEKEEEPPKASPIRQKLVLIGHYIMLGLAPVIAVIALGIGVVAVIGNRSVEEQLSKSIAKIDNLNANLATAKIELEKLKFSLAHEKSVQEEGRKILDEKIDKIIHNISPMQVKLKVHPTMEEQIRQAVVASTVLPVAASSVAASAAVSSVTEKKPATQTQIIKDAIEKYNKNN